ncbi:DnaJ domain-containing protein [Candidatus Daviesbacteria bacterium]|nr:DnaJ domain-containing protein [Candidatus Daviesbacteria bacterium]
MDRRTAVDQFLSERYGVMQAPRRRKDAHSEQVPTDKQVSPGQLVDRLSRENAQLREDKIGLQRQIHYLIRVGERLQWELDQERRGGKDPLDPKGYYKTLGINPDMARRLPEETLSELMSKVYRAYANAFHPDKGGDNSMMRGINMAYDFLRNPRSRQVYGR